MNTTLRRKTSTRPRSTKQKILDNAIHLFALKGYTETTIRELAAAVGVKEASIYNHFPSKNAILERILEEYSQISLNSLTQDQLAMLAENPTADGILSCLQLTLPEDKAEYYRKQMYVILQEQHRNPVVRTFMSESFILGTERVSRMIIDKLKESNKLRPDMDADFWVKMHSSLIYTFASRMLLGIGDQAPDFSGKGLLALLSNLYDVMLRTCGVDDDHPHRIE